MGLVRHSGSVGGSGVGNVSVAILEDQKTQNTGGGTFTTGADRTRDLNTEVSDPDGIVSLSSNQFTLGAGTFLIQWEAPAFECNGHQTMLYSVTGTAVVKRGGTAYASAADFTNNTSSGADIVVLGGSTTYEIRHACETTSNTIGFGRPGNVGVEVYTRVVITKLAA